MVEERGEFLGGHISIRSCKLLVWEGVIKEGLRVEEVEGASVGADAVGHGESIGHVGGDGIGEQDVSNGLWGVGGSSITGIEFGIIEVSIGVSVLDAA